MIFFRGRRWVEIKGKLDDSYVGSGFRSWILKKCEEREIVEMMKVMNLVLGRGWNKRGTRYRGRKMSDVLF